LDLIEQQQQQLQAKEKEIEELKSERDTLLARIERMERRMQLVKKDNEKERHKLFQGYETEEREETELSEKIKLEFNPKGNDFYSFTIDDFKLVNYNPINRQIKFELAE
jgi:male-specific lethal 1